MPGGFGLESYTQAGSGGVMSQGSNPNLMGYGNSQSGRHVSVNMNSQIGLGGTQNWVSGMSQDMGPGIIPQQQAGNNSIGFPNNRFAHSI